MTNWKTNLGGAISVTGTTLIGVGIVPQLAGVPSKILTGCAIVGFIMSAVGKGVTALFAADASQVKQLTARVENVENNTTTIQKS